MANKRVTDLPQAEKMLDGDILHIIQSGIDKQIPANKVGGGGVKQGTRAEIDAMILSGEIEEGDSYIVNDEEAMYNPADLNDIRTRLDSIVESGSNSNGRYIKFADGTMICTRRYQINDAVINTAWGALYESPLCTMGNFAMPFIEVPEVSMSLVGGTFLAPEKLNVTKNGLEPMQFYRPTSGTVSSAFSVIAIGRWK